jgi:hypothetical protein
MKRIFEIIAAFAVFALVSACGTGDDNANSGPAIGNATFSGAATGGLSEVVIAIESDQGASAHTEFVMQGASAGLTFSTTIALTTFDLAATTYDSSNTAVAEGSITTTTSTSTSYGMVGGSSAGTTAVGTFSLKITSIGTTHVVSGVTFFYGVHGTFTGSYDLSSAAGGTAANVNMTF